MREFNVQASNRIQLPGEAVFPESIGVDDSADDAYVGSLADGTLYRLTLDGEVEVWAPGGGDDRRSVAGVKVDANGRLWAAGGYEGTLHVYDLPSRSVVAQMDVGERPSCINDIAFGPDGTGYVTDSLISLLFRADGDPLTLRPWVDLAEQAAPWGEGLNFNGIVLTRDQRHLVACQTNLGRLWQMTLETGRVAEVALDGGPLQHCDGLAIRGSTLYVAINARDLIAVIELTADGGSGSVMGTLASEAFAFPTAVAVRDDCLLVVNGQLDKMGSEPRLPFTVVAIDRTGDDGADQLMETVELPHTRRIAGAVTTGARRSRDP